MPKKRDVFIKDATPSEIAAALRGRIEKGNDEPVLWVGPKGYNTDMMARDIEEGKGIGPELLASIRSEGVGKKLSELSHKPTAEDRKRSRQIINARMSGIESLLGMLEGKPRRRHNRKAR